MRISLMTIVAALMTTVLSTAAVAGMFSVSPIRMDLSDKTKTGSLNVMNEGGVLTLKTSVMRWTQDKDGVDRYEPSTDLIQFPRETEIAPGGSRLFRAAINTSQTDVEQAYRLFIEEVAPSAPEGGNSARISVLVKFGIPIYIAPSNPRISASLEAIKSPSGSHAFRLSNSGNVHFFVSGVTSQGSDFAAFKKQYLLPNAGLTLSVKEGSCPPAGTKITVETPEGSLSVNFPDGACSR